MSTVVENMGNMILMPYISDMQRALMVVGGSSSLGAHSGSLGIVEFFKLDASDEKECNFPNKFPVNISNVVNLSKQNTE